MTPGLLRLYKFCPRHYWTIPAPLTQKVRPLYSTT